MHPVCGNQGCVCATRIPEGDLPMKNGGLLFGRIHLSSCISETIWHWMWWLNIGYWIEKIIWMFFKKLSNVSKYTGVHPGKVIFEFQECPYCGYLGSYSFWEDRNITQTFPNGDWDHPID
jgi:hypothetical protein